MRRYIAVLALVFLSLGLSARAQETSAGGATDVNRVDALRRQMEDQRKDFEAKLQALQGQLDATRSQIEEQRKAFEAQIKEIENRQGAAPEFQSTAAAPQAIKPAVVLEPPVAAAPAAPAGPGQTMNPDISLIGDFLGHYDSRGSKADPATGFTFREAEVGLQSHIDPYARGDVFLSVGEHKDGTFSAEVEEAYLTLLTLPWDLQAKAGRFRSDFGKANPAHLHTLPWVDYPLAVRNFFGDDGLSGDGLSVSKLVPNPWNQYMEVEYQIFNANSESLFSDGGNPTLTHLVHAKDFISLSDSSTLECGLSGATSQGSPGEEGNRTYVEGADVTYKWRPPQEGLYKSFLFQNEAMASQKGTSGGMQHAWGAYSAAEYQLSERWFAGARYDYSQLPDDAAHHTNAGSTYLTFRQTEFAFWRIAYQHQVRNYIEAGAYHDDQVWLQLNFSMGAHGAHKY